MLDVLLEPALGLHQNLQAQGLLHGATPMLLNILNAEEDAMATVFLFLATFFFFLFHLVYSL